jgi:hypothetical protein
MQWRVLSARQVAETDTVGSLNFIIYSPRYDENVGGTIVLHKLCETLNRLGYTALLCPFGQRRFTWRGALLFWGRAANNFARTYHGRAGSGLFASRLLFPKASEIDDAVVVYPEIVVGNPLGAPRYVRWFLHKPGFHTGISRNFEGELCFYFLEAFQGHLPKAVCGGKLTLIEYFRNIYRLQNTGARHKVCYMVRKGKSRDDLPFLGNAWVVDGLSHKDMAKAFNECEKCFFYDPYTLYATYATLCGCIPIIVPLPGVTKEQWLPEEHLRFGLAYGEEDIPYSLATREQMIARLDLDEKVNLESVHNFLEKVREYFK